MNDVILNKISVIERCINRINEEYKNNSVNLSIVKEIIEKHIYDLKKFAEHMLQFYSK